MVLRCTAVKDRVSSDLTSELSQSLRSLPLRLARALLLLDDDLDLELDKGIGWHGRHHALLLDEGAGRHGRDLALLLEVGAGRRGGERL